MQISRDGVRSECTDLCSTCIKDDTECVLKKALSNYHGSCDNLPLSLQLADCPEYRRTENINNRISWYDTLEVAPIRNSDCITFNPNVICRFNTEDT